MPLPVDDDLETLYEQAPCGLLSMLPDGTIIRANRTLLSWLGRAPDEVVGARFQDLLTMPGRIFHDTHYMPLLMMKGVAREIAFDLHRPGSTPLPTMVTTVGDRDGAGRIEIFRSVVFESSSRRSYERELLHQRRAAEQEATARSALLAMLSHDIRSPLSSILMAIDMLDDTATVEARSRYVNVVRRAAQNILDLVNAILEHSRLEAGAVAWEPQPTDARALIGDIASIHGVKAEAKGIGLRTVVDTSVPDALLVDRYKLGQIVTNLVSNAIKFTERGEVRIELRASPVGEGAGEVDVELRVSDTGIGIPADKLDTIFDEFKQASPTTARRYGGTGLGLAISRKLAALAGGTIRVESTVGSGTAFSCLLRLPLARAADPHSRDADSASQG